MGAVVLGSAFVLLDGLTALSFDCHFSEEVVTVEQGVADDESAGHPNRSDSTQPPSIGLGDEVGVVKHHSLSLSIFISVSTHPS